jgi:type IV pilus assembly protein PilA
MLIKMKESKGFTLVELMIVVAIIGILAAVAVPFYQRYVQKSRLTSKVFPGLHSIETNIGAFYAVNSNLPTGSVAAYARDASTVCFQPAWTGTQLRLSINGNTACGMADLVSGLSSTPHLVASPVATLGKINEWTLSGPLADELGLQ